MKKIYIVVISVLIVLIGLGVVYFLYFKNRGKVEVETDLSSVETVEEGLPSVAPIENLAPADMDIVENIPSANPYENSKVNPLDEVQINPFK